MSNATIALRRKTGKNSRRRTLTTARNQSFLDLARSVRFSDDDIVSEGFSDVEVTFGDWTQVR